MTTVRVRLAVRFADAEAGRALASGVIQFRPTVRRVDAGDVILPKAFTVALKAGEDPPVVSFEVDDGETWAWQALERVKDGRGDWITFTVADVEPGEGDWDINYADLTEIDPDTLEPVENAPETVQQQLNALDESKANKDDLAPVATSGNYGDLNGKPTLGTAAAEDSTAFATAEQGGKADTLDTLVNEGRLSEDALGDTYGSFGVTLPELLAWQDFTTLANGAIDGVVTPTGQAWDGTGSEPPTVVSGGLQSTGTGYAFLDAGSKVSRIDVEFEYAGSGTNRTLTVALCQTMSTIDNLCHVNINPGGGDLSFLIGGAWSTNLQPSAGFKWVAPLLAGENYKVSVLVEGDTVLIIGPHGELFQLSDPRVAATAGNIFYVEPTNSASGMYPRVLRVAAFGVASRVPRHSMDGAGLLIDDNGRVAGNRFTGWEVAIGRGPTSGVPAVVFGARYVTARLTADVSAGATSISTDVPLPAGVYLSSTSDNLIAIDPQGADAETPTVSGNPGGSGPFTRTVSALAKAHPKGTLVFALANRWIEVYYNPVTQTFVLPHQTVINGTMYFGTGLDTALVRDSAGVLRMSGSQHFDVGGTWNGRHMRMGSNHLWVDSSGRLRIKSSAPSSDTDGTIVGAQS